jgi:ATP-binding cassette subfamily D (ALD) protein 3
VSNLDNRIANADQLLTQDVEKFCTSVSELYSNVSKPILDIFIYARKLSGAIGAQGPASMLGYLLVSGLLLTRLRRPIGKFTVNEQRLEGEFRFVNSRLITHSEEVAFYGGNEKERSVISKSFRGLVNHLRYSIQFRALLGIVDSIIAKYCASCVGYLVVSRPFFDLNNAKLRNASQAELMEEYYKSGRMLMNMALAVGRLVLAGRELTRLAGYTARVTELQNVLKDLNAGTYKRTMVSKNPASGTSTRELKPNSGKIITQDHIIKFEDVPIVTPNGDLLIESLSFEVRSGMNVLVAGPNGCGKSSLFRILGELWPLFGGTLTKPAKNKLFYVPQVRHTAFLAFLQLLAPSDTIHVCHPHSLALTHFYGVSVFDQMQRPYLALGTLRDQVIYPHSHEQFRKAGGTDEDLVDYLRQVQLDYLVEREGGWDAVSGTPCRPSSPHPHPTHSCSSFLGID